MIFLPGRKLTGPLDLLDLLHVLGRELLPPGLWRAARALVLERRLVRLVLDRRSVRLGSCSTARGWRKLLKDGVAFVLKRPLSM